MTDLDTAYANADFIPDAQAYPPRWTAKAQAFREALGARARLGVVYGPSERQGYDLFFPQTAPAGLMIFVHGGYWLRFDRASWSHLAAGALSRGWAVAMPSYDLCPAVQISDISVQIAAAVGHVAGEVEGPITLAGHSAGGHLVARMLAPTMLPPEVLERVQHVVPISPVADLRPLLRTSMNEAFKLDDAGAWAESPVAQPAPDRPVTVYVGAHERPVFLDQAAWLGAAWACPTILAPERHHFDVIDALEDPDSPLVGWLTPKG